LFTIPNLYFLYFFRYLPGAIKPKVLVVHDAGSTRKLASILNYGLGSEPQSAEDIQLHDVGDYLVAVTPSLAPPAYNKWSRWSNEHLSLLAKEIATYLRKK